MVLDPRKYSSNIESRWERNGDPLRGGPKIGNCSVNAKMRIQPGANLQNRVVASPADAASWSGAAAKVIVEKGGRVD